MKKFTEGMKESKKSKHWNALHGTRMSEPYKKVKMCLDKNLSHPGGSGRQSIVRYNSI